MIIHIESEENKLCIVGSVELQVRQDDQQVAAAAKQILFLQNQALQNGCTGRVFFGASIWLRLKQEKSA